MHSSSLKKGLKKGLKTRLKTSVPLVDRSSSSGGR